MRKVSRQKGRGKVTFQEKKKKKKNEVKEGENY